MGLPVGLSSTGLTLGSAAASPFLAWMIVEFGWRWAFLVLSPLGLILSGLWWWYSRDNPAEHRSINQAEVDLITGGRESPMLAPINPPGWVRVLRTRNILFLTGSYACSNFVFYTVMSYFFLYLVEARMFDEIKAGALSGQIWLLAAGGAAFGGWLCDRLCKKLGLRWGYRWPIIIGQGGCALLFCIGAYYANPLLAVAILSFAFTFQQMTEGAYWAASISIGRQFAGAAGGILNTGANVMGAINAVVLVWLAESHGWAFAMASNAVVTLLALLLMLPVRGDEPVPLD
jgi:ACS family glucarate transporter-like MFS transporter